MPTTSEVEKGPREDRRMREIIGESMEPASRLAECLVHLCILIDLDVGWGVVGERQEAKRVIPIIARLLPRPVVGDLEGRFRQQVRVVADSHRNAAEFLRFGLRVTSAEVAVRQGPMELSEEDRRNLELLGKYPGTRKLYPAETIASALDTANELREAIGLPLLT